MKQEKFTWVLRAASLAITLGVISPAQASPAYCPAAADIAADDVTYNTFNANGCYGVVSGNINGASDINGLGLTWGTDWGYLDGTDSNSGTYQGIQFTVTAVAAANETTEGTWRITGVDVNGSAPLNLPITLDLAVGLKAADRYALWYFDNVAFTGTGNGTWEIEFKNKGGRHPDLSHMIVFGRDASGTTVPTPVPAAAWLLGSGLIGLAGVMRRKR